MNNVKLNRGHSNVRCFIPQVPIRCWHVWCRHESIWAQSRPFCVPITWSAIRQWQTRFGGASRYIALLHIPPLFFFKSYSDLGLDLGPGRSLGPLRATLVHLLLLHVTWHVYNGEAK